MRPPPGAETGSNKEWQEQGALRRMTIKDKATLFQQDRCFPRPVPWRRSTPCATAGITTIPTPGTTSSKAGTMIPKRGDSSMPTIPKHLCLPRALRYSTICFRTVVTILSYIRIPLVKYLCGSYMLQQGRHCLAELHT